MSKLITIKKPTAHGVPGVLDSGTKVFLPKELAILGNNFEESDFVFTATSGATKVYKTFVPAPRVKKEPVLVRDMSDFDVEKELNLIQACVLRKRNLMGDLFVCYNIEDIRDAIFAYFWETKFFQTYDKTRGFGYSSYIATGVQNWMINKVRDGNFRRDQFTDSLDFKLDSSADDENSASAESLLPDRRISIENELIVKELEAFLVETAVSMGECELLVGLQYSDLLNVLLVNGSIPQFARSHGLSYKKINAEVQKLRDSLKEALVNSDWIEEVDLIRNFLCAA